MIVFVVFPWFSESILGVFDIGPVFYRAFSRRCFCQYASDENPAGNVVEDLDDSVTMAEVTKSLSGVIFIEDRSVLEGDAPDSSVKAFAYLNPNANHKPSRHYRHHLEALRIPIDDFEFDNY